MSMAPKDGDIIKDGIAELLGGLIGSTGDTGGTETDGTVMAKENAILGQVNSIKDDVQISNRKLIKQSEKKRFGPVSSTSGITVLEFDFPQPVQFIAICSKLNGEIRAGNAVPIYLINGEDSIKVNQFRVPTDVTHPDTIQFLCAGYLNNIQNRGDLFVFNDITISGSGAIKVPFPYPIYIKKFRMELPNIMIEAGNPIDFSVYYLE